MKNRSERFEERFSFYTTGTVVRRTTASNATTPFEFADQRPQIETGIITILVEGPVPSEETFALPKGDLSAIGEGKQTEGATKKEVTITLGVTNHYYNGQRLARVASSPSGE